nr:PKD domain-containing protein [Pyxidicoccus fallax]
MEAPKSAPAKESPPRESRLEGAEPGSNLPPVANAGGPYYVEEASSILLDGSGSSDPEGGPLTYAWDLDGDGDFDDAQEPSPSYFGTDGWIEYTVGLRVCDDAGACDSQTTSLMVGNAPPTALTLGPSVQTLSPYGTATLTATFTDPVGASDGPFFGYWIIGDNSYGPLPIMSPYGTPLVESFSFRRTGTYPVTLMIIDKDGGMSEGISTATIIVRTPAPVVDTGGPYVTLEGASAVLDGSGTHAPDGAWVLMFWDLDNDGNHEFHGPIAPFPGVDGPNTHIVGLKACSYDDTWVCMFPETATTTVQVLNAPPVTHAGEDQSVSRGDVVTLTGTWSDPAGAADNPYTVAWDLDGDGTFDVSGTANHGDSDVRTKVFSEAGTYTLRFQVTDKDGDSHVDTLVVTVANRPPDCAAAAPSVSRLWPPNHQLRDVSILGVTDADGDALAVTFTSIRQDEPVNGAADGAGVGTPTAKVRAERSGPGNGRVYHLGFSASDRHGGTCTGTVTVGVPHDQGRGATPVDDGPLYDSTRP